MLGSRTPFGNRAPEKPHVVFEAGDLRPGRVIVIGDVHGCLDELESLLKSCDYRDEDNLIFAGDLVNKGPQSYEVFTKVRELRAAVVRGNHEDASLALRRRLSAVMSLVKRYKWTRQLTDADVAYLQQLPFSITLKDYHTTIVHAGLVPDGTALTEQTFKAMLFLEDVETDNSNNTRFKCYYTSNLEKPSQCSWAKHWKGKQHVLFGHASERQLQKHEYATGLDTGCVGGGELTACILPPLKDLQESSAFLKYKQQFSAVRAPTLEELGATFVQVVGRGAVQLGYHDPFDDPPHEKLESQPSAPLERDTMLEAYPQAVLGLTSSAPASMQACVAVDHATNV